MMTLLANINFQAPDIVFYDLIPIVIFGLLMAGALALESGDERNPDQSEGLGPYRPTILGVGAIGLTCLLGYYLNYEGNGFSLSFNEMLVNDSLSRASGFLITVCALLVILAGPDELQRYRSQRSGEFCALIFAASLGMILMAMAANTMVLFLGLELFSLALYLLCIFLPERAAGREAGMKYFLLSSTASAILLYGLALLYGSTGTTWILEMSEVSDTAHPGLALAGAVMVLCGLLFKLAIVPFHFWAPDVYEGAPTTVTAFMSVATKVAAIAALWRLIPAFSELASQISLLILFSVAALTILVGNFLALAQSNVKRMLAYSGIANAGYLLIAPATGADMMVPMLFFLSTYLVGNIGAFLALAQVEALLGKEIEFQDLHGLFHRKPWLASCMAISLVSLAGLPPAAGFMGKFLLFGKALSTSQFFLPVLAIAGSVIGAGYYLRATVKLFAKLNEEDEVAMVETEFSTSHVALGLCVAGVLYLGLLPGEFIARLASGSL